MVICPVFLHSMAMPTPHDQTILRFVNYVSGSWVSLLCSGVMWFWQAMEHHIWIWFIPVRTRYSMLTPQVLCVFGDSCRVTTVCWIVVSFNCKHWSLFCGTAQLEVIEYYRIVTLLHIAQMREFVLNLNSVMMYFWQVFGFDIFNQDMQCHNDDYRHLSTFCIWARTNDVVRFLEVIQASGMLWVFQSKKFIFATCAQFCNSSKFHSKDML